MNLKQRVEKLENKKQKYLTQLDLLKHWQLGTPLPNLPVDPAELEALKKLAEFPS